ncbi:MAG: hypothetical protein KDE51_01475, partial [Anaerolineales bacterium]|nr:hypothetical protein [Anaerolineales bacterium]
MTHFGPVKLPIESPKMMRYDAITMARTTITLPNTLHHQLAIKAQHEGKGLSSLVRELLRKALQREEAIS